VPGHRFFAALYDRMLSGTEKAGLSEMRSALVAGARGRTLELGAGTGLNLPHYTEAVTELVATEPDPFMARKLRDKLSQASPAPGSTKVVETAAETLPFEDDSFDTVVGTLVLCTVDDPDAAVREIRRVLRPDGQLLYLEHVRDPDEGGLARWQDRLERPWGWVGAGCHPNRDTATTLAAAGFDIEPNRGELPKAPPWVRPMIRGSAGLQT
jgi:ubiquinone/menaquinone biosynthesis C-methylase UbiE